MKFLQILDADYSPFLLGTAVPGPQLTVLTSAQGFAPETESPGPPSRTTMVTSGVAGSITPMPASAQTSRVAQLVSQAVAVR